MYGTIIQIAVTTGQLTDLTELIRGAVRLELADYIPPTPEGANLPDLLTRRQAADTLQVSLTTLNEWAKDTESRSAILVPLKMNGRIRYRRSEVLSVLKESRRFKLGKGQQS